MVSAPTMSFGSITKDNVAKKGKVGSFENKLFGGAHLVLYRNLHRITDGTVHECEVHRMWLAFIGGMLHLTWVSKSDIGEETRLESVNLSRVISVDLKEVLKVTTDCGTEIATKVIMMRTPTQKFALGPIRTEDFDGLSSCLEDCVEECTRRSLGVGSNGSNGQSGGRRASMSFEKFNRDEVARLGGEITPTHNPRYLNGDVGSTFGGNNKGRRGSHSTLSVTSGTTTDSEAIEFGGDNTENGGMVRPIAMRSHMEVVRKRGENGISVDSASSSRRAIMEAGGNQGVLAAPQPVAEDKGVGVEDDDGEGSEDEANQLGARSAAGIDSTTAHKVASGQPVESRVLPRGLPPPPPTAPAAVRAPASTPAPATPATPATPAAPAAPAKSAAKGEAMKPRTSSSSNSSISARMSQLSTFSSFKKKSPAKMAHGPTGPARRKQSSKQVKGVWGSYVQKTQKRLSKTDKDFVAPGKNDGPGPRPLPPPPPPPPVE